MLRMNKTWWFNPAAGHRLNYSPPVNLTKMLFSFSPPVSSAPLALLFLQSLTRRRCRLLWLSKSLTLKLVHFWCYFTFIDRFVFFIPAFLVLSLSSISFCSRRILLSRGMCMSERGVTGSLSWTMAVLWSSKVNGISPSCLTSWALQFMAYKSYKFMAVIWLCS